jgi:hypothetical protein
VASSNIKILLLRNIALARHINCRCPILKFNPSSEIFVSNPLFNFVIAFFSSTLRRKAFTNIVIINIHLLAGWAKQIHSNLNAYECGVARERLK